MIFDARQKTMHSTYSLTRVDAGLRIKVRTDGSDEESSGGEKGGGGSGGEEYCWWWQGYEGDEESGSGEKGSGEERDGTSKESDDDGVESIIVVKRWKFFLL